MGSSIVMMVWRWFWLMVSIRLARVVDFPEPVGPVTRTRPRDSLVRFTTEGIRPSSWGVGMRAEMTRRTAAGPRRCWKTLTRKRDTFGMAKEQSSSQSLSKRARWSSYRIE